MVHRRTSRKVFSKKTRALDRRNHAGTTRRRAERPQSPQETVLEFKSADRTMRKLSLKFHEIRNSLGLKKDSVSDVNLRELIKAEKNPEKRKLLSELLRIKKDYVFSLKKSALFSRPFQAQCIWLEKKMVKSSGTSTLTTTL